MAETAAQRRGSWSPEDITIDYRAPVTAGFVFHGSLGDPGYHALHPGNVGKGKTRSEHGGMLGSPDYTAEEHQAAVTGYVADDSEGMNGLLRHGESAGGMSDEEARTRNRTLNDLIDIQDPLAESKTLYRGGYDFPSDLQPGDEISDRGFTSFSDSERTGRRFAGQAKTRRDKTKPPGTMATVTVPKGARILQVASVDPDADLEQEWIGRPGSRFRVTSVSDDGLDIGLEMIP